VRSRFRLTPLGAVIGVLFCGALAVALLGSGTAQVAGMVAALLIAAFVVGGVPFAYRYRMSGVRVPEPEVLDEAPPDAQAWRQEREHRERAQEESPASRKESVNAFGKRRS
jgi:hypothetical protein